VLRLELTIRLQLVLAAQMLAQPEQVEITLFSQVLLLTVAAVAVELLMAQAVVLVVGGL
jgi:hypothetical protein